MKFLRNSFSTYVRPFLALVAGMVFMAGINSAFADPSALPPNGSPTPIFTDLTVSNDLSVGNNLDVAELEVSGDALFNGDVTLTTINGTAYPASSSSSYTHPSSISLSDISLDNSLVLDDQDSSGYTTTIENDAITTSGTIASNESINTNQGSIFTGSSILAAFSGPWASHPQLTNGDIVSADDIFAGDQLFVKNGATIGGNLQVTNINGAPYSSSSSSSSSVPDPLTTGTPADQFSSSPQVDFLSNITSVTPTTIRAYTTGDIAATRNVYADEDVVASGGVFAQEGYFNGTVKTGFLDAETSIYSFGTITADSGIQGNAGFNSQLGSFSTAQGDINSGYGDIYTGIHHPSDFPSSFPNLSYLTDVPSAIYGTPTEDRDIFSADDLFASDDIVANDELIVEGTANLRGGASIGSPAYLQGFATIADYLTVGTSLSVGTNLTVTGNTTMTGNLTVAGTTTLGSIAGEISTPDTISTGTPADQAASSHPDYGSGDILSTDDVFIDDQLFVAGFSRFEKNVQVYATSLTLQNPTNLHTIGTQSGSITALPFFSHPEFKYNDDASEGGDIYTQDDLFVGDHLYVDNTIQAKNGSIFVGDDSTPHGWALDVNGINAEGDIKGDNLYSFGTLRSTNGPIRTGNPIQAYGDGDIAATRHLFADNNVDAGGDVIAGDDVIVRDTIFNDSGSVTVADSLNVTGSQYIAINSSVLGHLSANSIGQWDYKSSSTSSGTSVSTSCDSGEIRVSCSGYNTANSTDPYKGAYPTGGTGCTARRTTTGGTLYVYAYCFDPNFAITAQPVP
jgi:hypothetical protein